MTCQPKLGIHVTIGSIVPGSVCQCGFSMIPFPAKLTPQSSIDALEERFRLGEKTKGPDAWNATTDPSKLDNIDWIEERIDHADKHIQHYLAVLLWNAEDNGDDDGAAIMWLGCMLHEAWIRRRASKKD